MKQIPQRATKTAPEAVTTVTMLLLALVMGSCCVIDEPELGIWQTGWQEGVLHMVQSVHWRSRTGEHEVEMKVR